VVLSRCAPNGKGELLSTEEIAGRVIAAKGFDAGDAILRAAIRGQVGSIVKRLHREGTIENIGAVRTSKWKLMGWSDEDSCHPASV
jgi:hypothetical protein